MNVWIDAALAARILWGAPRPTPDPRPDPAVEPATAPLANHRAPVERPAHSG